MRRNLFGWYFNMNLFIVINSDAAFLFHFIIFCGIPLMQQLKPKAKIVTGTLTRMMKHF